MASGLANGSAELSEYSLVGRDCGSHPPHGRIASVITFSVLTVVVIAVIIMGNTLVCVAVGTERNLKAAQHRFLVSLAAADLMVGILIMPLGFVNQVLGYWVFGAVLCDIWKAVDVLACTASIWNLCLIAIDRYYSITRAMTYTAWRTPRRVNWMIMFVWTLSILISVPPLFGWEEKGSPTGRFKCLISDDVGYILFSTLLSFYLPAVIMIIVYVKVWRAASYRARSNSNPSGSFKTKAPQSGDYNNGHHSPALVVKTKMNRKCSCELNGVPSGKTRNGEKLTGDVMEDASCLNVVTSDSHKTSARSRSNTVVDQSKRKLAQKREMRATLVLGVIMGTFLACWYPFFQLYVISALCGEACSIPTLLFDVIFWIGYCNSALNPIIYTVFNRDFRRAFSRILKRLLRKPTCQNYRTP